MPNLDAGESAKIVLGPSDSVRVSAPGQASVLAISGAPSGTTTVTAQTRDFGPYNVAAVLRITGVSGITSYGTVDPVPLSNPELSATRALVLRDWILNGASAGAASAWIQFSPNQRISYALDSGSAATTAAVDYSFDGGATSAGQAYTISYSSSAAFEIGILQMPPFFVNLVQAARNAGTFTGYFFRVTVLSGGPLSIFNNP